MRDKGLRLKLALFAAAAGMLSGAALAAPPQDLIRALLSQERAIYEGWRARSTAPLDAVLGEDAVAWSGYGAQDRAAQLSQQAKSNAACDVKSYSFHDPKVVRVAPDAAVLYYRLEQDAVCGGGSAPTPVANTSVYALRRGRWVNVFRTFSPVPPP